MKVGTCLLVPKAWNLQRINNFKFQFLSDYIFSVLHAAVHKLMILFTPLNLLYIHNREATPRFFRRKAVRVFPSKSLFYLADISIFMYFKLE